MISDIMDTSTSCPWPLASFSWSCLVLVLCTLHSYSYKYCIEKKNDANQHRQASCGVSRAVESIRPYAAVVVLLSCAFNERPGELNNFTHVHSGSAETTAARPARAPTAALSLSSSFLCYGVVWTYGHHRPSHDKTKATER